MRKPNVRDTPALTAHTAVFDEVTRQMVVFGGESATGTGRSNDVWSLSGL
jgi:hypothetical protein